MESLKIKASPKQLSKLRNGHKVRISRDVEGTGFNLIVNPATYNLATKAFGKGKGMMVQLSPEELSANREVEGNGIFSKIKKGFKKAGKAIKKGAEFVGDNIVKGAKSKVGKKILTTLAKEALEKGLPALAMGAATALGQPELAPVVGRVAGLAGKQASKAVSKEIDGMGLYAGGGLYAGARSTRGGGLYAGASGRGVGVMGRGSLLNVSNSKLPPALQSQNASANFHFSTQLPPAYANLK
jgi:hypothetical protein